ncbi:GntR family transcriptional regulator [Polymorphum gilvum]|uniref:Transcriptional regulator, GntR family protein n=1 Tax=Polymorphum gilvum (strain LMG 25793 / CGMCC 1.9160 / SL003B-26A1) TaxID=991905 RepID=F2IWA8_POLGS|nr:GntR family transcriptional regulator [Polymorphum gilvum]ADZ71493.1 Transcriptional regulator, GntR family protein [Polymorphum gilvum SL003B-26A1]
MSAPAPSLHTVFPIESGRKSAQIYSCLKRKIVLGLLSGDSIVTEQALAQDHGCSQGTVREALLRLEQDGLVCRNGYQGTYVTRTTDDEAELLVRLRVDLECAGIARACGRLDPDSRDFLTRSIVEYHRFRDSGDVFMLTEIDRVFHLRVFDLAGLPNLEPLLARVLLQLHRYTISRTRGHILWKDMQTDPHAEIIRGLESGDPELCRQLVTDHIAGNILLFAPLIHQRVFGRNAG